MRKILKPGKDGLLVRDPVSKRHLHADGEEKEINSYWMRRLICGDVVEVEQPESKSPDKKSSNKSKEA